MDEIQKEVLKKGVICADASSSGRIIFEDEIALMQIDSRHRIASSRIARLKAFSDHFEIDGRPYNLSDILGVAIRSRNTIVTYLASTGTQYEIKGTNKMFCALKYLYLYEIIRSKEQTE